MPLLSSPIAVDSAKSGGLGQIIGIQQADPFFDQGLPYGVPRADGECWCVPIAAKDALGGSIADVRPQGGKLGVVELGALDLPNIPAELGRCNW